MTLLRKEIRHITVELLLGNTAAGNNVFASRIIPNKLESLPVINVYTNNELADTSSEAPLSHKRTMDLVCEIITANAVNDGFATDQADEIAEQVENIIFKQEADKNSKLGCIVDGITLGGVTFEYESNGEASVNSCRISFNVAYNKIAVTEEADNTTDLDRMGIDWDVGTASDPDPEAQDLIELGP